MPKTHKLTTPQTMPNDENLIVLEKILNETPQKIELSKKEIVNIPTSVQEIRDLEKTAYYEFLISTGGIAKKESIKEDKSKAKDVRKYVLPIDEVFDPDKETSGEDSDKEKENKKERILKHTHWGHKVDEVGKGEPKKKTIAPIVQYAGYRKDAWTQVHPAGYNEVPSLAKPADDMIEPKNPNPNMETQVTEMLINAERSALRHLELEEDNILWPTIGEFDQEKIVRIIEDYFDLYCEFDSGWEHYTNFIQESRDNYRSKFIYEVKWCRPTESLPVPKATVSVFFTIELPHYAALDDTVKVNYVLEGTRFPHAPGKIPFQQKWLYDILLDKLKIQEEIDF